MNKSPNTSITSPRCLYHAPLSEFIASNSAEILGKIVESYHGDSQSTTIESWCEEIRILKEQLGEWDSEDAHIIFEYRAENFIKILRRQRMHRVSKNRDDPNDQKSSEP